MMLPQSNQNKFDDKYWDERYQKGQTGWDIGYPSKPLTEYIDQLKDHELRILIPGCGNGYEALYLLEKGFKNITLVDISLEAVNRLRERMPAEIEILHQDFFELDTTYDLILEQTFFCALDPSMRDRYAEKMYELLNEGGTLAGVFFNREFEQAGPPFGGNLEEYLQIFGKKFKLHKAEPCYNSIAPRAGTEVFLIFKK